MKIIFLTFLLFLTDQLSKLLVRGFSLPWFNLKHSGFYLGESKPVINNFLHITLVENPGIAFGIIPGVFIKDLILIITILLCLGFFGFLIFSKDADRRVRISVGLILAGAAGNLFDRVFYGYFYNYAPLFQGKVVDFLDVKFFKFFMFGNLTGNYVFNFADLSITAGIITLIYLTLKFKKKREDTIIVQKLVEERQDPS
ncbi:MAG: signal peptidase II [Ignavibacteriaceae bacterium]|nr:signal peptidase II [Ignavibacteriaceae bacterium]